MDKHDALYNFKPIVIDNVFTQEEYDSVYDSVNATFPKELEAEVPPNSGYFNAGDTFNTGNKTQINLLDSGSGFIALNTNTGRAILGDFNGINNGYLFEANAGERFFTSNGGQASRCDEITTALTQIEMFNNFITSNVDVELKAPASYLNGLNGPNGEGWFCYIQNISSGNITISSAVGTDFVFGALLASFVIGPYTTRRFTLTYWTNDGVYYWSVL
jgi:hypothetical protein